MNQSERQRYLTCGTRRADLVEQVAERGSGVRTPHQASCTQCQTALRDLEWAWQAVDLLRSEAVQPPARLLERVMRRVRAELVSWNIEVRGEHGLTQLSAQVFAMIAYETAESVPGVSAVHRSQPARVSDGVDVALELSLVFGYSAPEVGAVVRRRLMSRVRQLTGLAVGAVQIKVSDVVAP